MGEGIGLHLTASFVAGFITAFAVNPMDVAKTRIMNENLHAKETTDLNYRSAWQTYKVIFRTEGMGGFYKGVIPSWLRIGPHTVCLLYTSPSPRDGLLSRMPSSA